jgi:hypothetical protein
MHGINNCLQGLELGSSRLSVKVCTTRGLKGVSQGLRLKSDPGWCTGSHNDPKSHCLYIIHYCSVFLLGIVVAKCSRMGLGYANTPFPCWHIPVQYYSLALQQ